jgi:hypothetical protein
MGESVELALRGHQQSTLVLRHERMGSNGDERQSHSGHGAYCARRVRIVLFACKKSPNDFSRIRYTPNDKEVFCTRRSYSMSAAMEDAWKALERRERSGLADCRPG